VLCRVIIKQGYIGVYNIVHDVLYRGDTLGPYHPYNPSSRSHIAGQVWSVKTFIKFDYYTSIYNVYMRLYRRVRDKWCSDVYMRLYGRVTLQELSYSVNKVVPTDTEQMSHLAAHMCSVCMRLIRGVVYYVHICSVYVSISVSYNKFIYVASTQSLVWIELSGNHNLGQYNQQ
jgi:hypothetical protein